MNCEFRVAYEDTWVRHRYAEKIQRMAAVLQEELKLLKDETESR